MIIKLLVNLFLSIIGIITFYLIRRKEINRRIKKVLLVDLKNIIIELQRYMLRYLLLIALAITFSFYHITRYVDDKIMDFVVGKNRKYNSYSNSKKTSEKGLREKCVMFCKKQDKKLSDKFEEKKIKEETKDYNSITDMLINEKSKRNETAMLGMFLFVIIYYCLFLLSNIDIQCIIYILLTVLIWLIVIYQILLIYRSKKSYYGTNYDEAKEIIYFIKKSSDDGINPPGGKKFLNEVEENIVVTSGQKVIV